MDAIINVITSQIEFNKDLNPSALYDEIINHLQGNYSKFDLLGNLKDFNKIEQSANFKYLINTNKAQVSIINKYH